MIGRERVKELSRKRIIGFLLLAVGTSSCDQQIDPIQTTDMAYSIFGYLDPSSDEQWVRVTPFRTSIFSTPDQVDALVMVEELESGREFELVPVLFKQRAGNFGDTLYAYNFRTTERILPKTTYRLTSVRSDGNTSTTTVRTPPDFAPEHPIVVGTPRFSLTNYVRFHVPPRAHVAIVQTRHTLVPEKECPLLVHYHVLPERPPTDAGGEFQMNLREPEGSPPDGCVIGWQEVRIVLSGEAWPFDAGSDNTHIHAVNNIENGVGFLGGVVVKDTPYQAVQCTSQSLCERPVSVERATLTVTVVNGSPRGMQLVFAPNVKLVVPRASSDPDYLRLTGRPATEVSPPGTSSPTFRYMSLGTWTQRIRVEGGSGFYCEDRTITLSPGEHHMEVTVVPRAAFPNEPTNAQGCREG